MAAKALRDNGCIDTGMSLYRLLDIVDRIVQVRLSLLRDGRVFLLLMGLGLWNVREEEYDRLRGLWYNSQELYEKRQRIRDQTSTG